MDKDIKEILSVGKLRLMRTRDTAFFAHILLQLNEEFDTHGVQSCGVDGRSIVYNSDFIRSLKSPDELMFLLMHEIMHIVLEHISPMRRNGRDPQKWNVAGDYVINAELVSAGYTMPEGGLYDKKYEGLLTEEVYDMLPEGMEMPEGQSDIIEIGGDASEGSESSSGGSKPITEQELKDLITGAYTAQVMAKGDMGKLPGMVKRLVDSWLNPKLPWQNILQRFLNETSNDDFSWKKMNRRMLPHGIYMPSMTGEGLSRIDFAIDVSGSISDKEFHLFTSEVAGVLTQFDPKEIGIMQFDSTHLGTDIVRSIEDFRKVEYLGGGGTCLVDTLQEFKNSPAEALIIFTDGYLSTNLQAPTRPVIWCVYDNADFKQAFGQLIHFKLSDLKGK